MSLSRLIVPFIALDLARHAVHASGSAIDAETADERKHLATTRHGGGASRIHQQQERFCSTESPVYYRLRDDSNIIGNDERGSPSRGRRNLRPSNVLVASLSPEYQGRLKP